LVHIKEHAKLYILSGGQRLLRGSWPFGAGVWEIPHTNFEILVFGELYAPTMAATDQLWTWGFLHIQEDVKLHILSGGRFFLRGFGIVGAGVWEFSHTNFEIFGFGGTIWTNGASHRPAMDMGVGTY